MSALIAPTEPLQLREIGDTSALAETMGADILIPSTQGYFLGIQRKVFPGDFLSSLSDGRLSTSLVKLMQCDVRVLLLEGKPAWTTSGFLNHDYVQFSRSQLRALLLSAETELGVHTEWTDNLTDTIDYIRDLVRWSSKPKHTSLFTRPGPAQPYKRKLTRRDRAIYLLQGFDGIGPELAGRIFDHFGRVPLAWENEDQLAEVPGIGKGRVAKLRELFNG